MSIGRNEDLAQRVRALEVEMETQKEEKRSMKGEIKALQKVVWGAMGVLAAIEIALKFIGK